MTDHAKLIARLEQDEARLRGLNEICSGLGGKCKCEGCQHRLRRADNLREAIAALIADRPVFWQHAIQECNEAHQALDLKGAPRTKTVARLRGVGEQEITLGLRARIQALTADRAAESHRCSGCSHRWDGPLTGVELCGDCWRKVQPVVHQAAEAAPPEGLAWQPIETAPKEPRAILGKAWDGHVHPVWWNRTYPRWEWCGDGYHSGAAPRLTHWMPLDMPAAAEPPPIPGHPAWCAIHAGYFCSCVYVPKGLGGQAEAAPPEGLDATERATIRATVLEEVAIWLDGFDFPEARPLAKQVRSMAKDAIEDAEPALMDEPPQIEARLRAARAAARATALRLRFAEGEEG